MKYKGYAIIVYPQILVKRYSMENGDYKEFFEQWQFKTVDSEGKLSRNSFATEAAARDYIDGLKRRKRSTT